MCFKTSYYFVCGGYCQIAGLFLQISKDTLKVNKISNWKSKLSLTWLSTKKMFKLQQTLTLCHTGHFSPAFFPFLIRGCQEHELYLNSSMPTFTKIHGPAHIHIHTAVFGFCSVDLKQVWVSCKEMWKVKTSGFSHNNLSSPSSLINHFHPFLFSMHLQLCNSLSLLAWTFNHCNLLTFRPALLLELLKNPWLVWKSSKVGKRREPLRI